MKYISVIFFIIMVSCNSGSGWQAVSYELPRHAIELLNYYPADERIEIEELTWDISDDAQVSDGGVERLTIWYVKAKDKEKARTDSYLKLPSIWERPSVDNNQQFPVNYLKWNINMQF